MEKHPVYNVHTHIFNFDCVPDGFLSNYLPRQIAPLIAKLLRRPIMARIVRFITARMVRKFATFVALGTKRTPLDVFNEMILSYRNEDARFVVLPMNFDYMGGGEAPADHITQLQMVLSVRAQYPNQCLPFVSVDARQGNKQGIHEHISKYIGPPNYQFIGIKIYPSLGFYPTDERLESMYEYAVKHEIPILTHCTKDGTFYAAKRLPVALHKYNSFHPTTEVANRHKTTMYVDVNLDRPDDACDNFLDPVNYIDILEKFSTLKICFAHFGGEGEMNAVFDASGKRRPTHPPLTKKDFLNPGGLDPKTSWFRIVEYLLTHYENVYTDISFTLYDDKLYPALKSLMQNAEYKSRILFGTDFFMTTQYKSEYNLYDEFRTALGDPLLWKAVAYDNPRRFLQSKFFSPT